MKLEKTKLKRVFNGWKNVTIYEQSPNKTDELSTIPELSQSYKDKYNSFDPKYDLEPELEEAYEEYIIEFRRVTHFI